MHPSKQFQHSLFQEAYQASPIQSPGSTSGLTQPWIPPLVPASPPGAAELGGLDPKSSM